jgi:hypothetical protein
MAKSEKVLIEHASLRDIFKEDFLEQIKASGKDIFPVTIVFMNEFDVDGKKQAYPIVLNHNNNDEVKNRILHIESPNTELLELFIKAIEKRKK